MTPAAPFTATGIGAVWRRLPGLVAVTWVALFAATGIGAVLRRLPGSRR